VFRGSGRSAWLILSLCIILLVAYGAPPSTQEVAQERQAATVNTVPPPTCEVVQEAQDTGVNTVLDLFQENMSPEQAAEDPLPHGGG